MKFPHACKLHLAVLEPSQPSRFGLKGVYHDRDAKALVATDGRMLALVPVEDNESDSPGILDAAAIKAATAGRAPRGGEATLAHNGQTVVQDGKGGQRIFPVPEEQRFPDYRAVMPAGQGDVQVCLDVPLLWKLAQALGCEKVCLHLYRGRDDKFPGPFRVEPLMDDGPPGRLGVLMPIST